MKDRISARGMALLVAGMVLIWINPAVGKEASEIRGLPGWEWTGEDGSVRKTWKGWKLSGGVLEYTQPGSKPGQWLLLDGRLSVEGTDSAVALIDYNGCKVRLYPIETDWVPMVDDLPIRTDYGADREEFFTMGVRFRESGKVDFAWAGYLMIEGAALGSMAEERLEIAVPAGSVLEINRLEWEKNVPKLAKEKGKREKVNPPGERPPPHPYIAMDEERRILAYPGGPAAEGTGSLHASGNRVGDEEASNSGGTDK